MWISIYMIFYLIFPDFSIKNTWENIYFKLGFRFNDGLQFTKIYPENSMKITIYKRLEFQFTRNFSLQASNFNLQTIDFNLQTFQTLDR